MSLMTGLSNQVKYRQEVMRKRSMFLSYRQSLHKGGLE